MKSKKGLNLVLFEKMSKILERDKGEKKMWDFGFWRENVWEIEKEKRDRERYKEKEIERERKRERIKKKG